MNINLISIGVSHFKNQILWLLKTLVKEVLQYIYVQIILDLKQPKEHQNLYLPFP